MDLQRLDELETIGPSPLLPLRAEPFAEIEVGSDRETALERAKTVRSTSNVVVYSDASEHKGHLGAAVVALNGNLETVESQQIQVGPMDWWSFRIAELIGIFYAIRMVADQPCRQRKTRGTIWTADRPSDPPSCHRGPNRGNHASPSVGAWALS